MKASATWRQGLTFDTTTDRGHQLVLAGRTDDDPSAGPNPVETVLAALAACTAMDVVDILGKMRQPLFGLRVEAAADRAQEHPRVFTRIQLHYKLSGRDLNGAQVERAIQLSQEKYCSISAMLRPTVTMAYTWSMEELGDSEPLRA
jgi:putative redox protein